MTEHSLREDASRRGHGNGWRERARQRQAQRALERQLDYQQQKARRARGHEGDHVETMRRHVEQVRARIQRLCPIAENARVLEVGSGAHGLIFYFGAGCGVGVDPLAAHYASLFPVWQRRALTVAALGEQLPIADGWFDLVLCDNVVDHAEDPGRIVREMARVLRPGGLLYFTVNVHHPIYGVAASLHAAWNAAGLRLEISPFADHTVHLTLARARALFSGLPFTLLHETNNIGKSNALTRRRPPHHMGDGLKRVFFKNARYELVAVRT